MRDNQFFTPVGRLVRGDCFTPTFDEKIVWKKGPDKGKIKPNYYIGVAFSKTDANILKEFEKVRAIFLAEAIKSFPNKFDKAGNCISPDFAFKITDGDSAIPNSREKRPCDFEGYPGHWVINFSTAFPPSIVNKEAKPLESVSGILKPIKLGDYIRVFGTVVGNGSPDKSGIMLNHKMVQLIQPGVEIKLGLDAKSIIDGATAPVLPAGVQDIPKVPVPTTNFLNPDIKYLDPAGNSFTVIELKSAGYTDAMISGLARA